MPATPAECFGGGIVHTTGEGRAFRFETKRIAQCAHHNHVETMMSTNAHTPNPKKRNRNVWGVILLVAALAIFVSAFLAVDRRPVDPWHGRAAVQPMDVTLKTIGREGERRTAEHLYEGGWWSFQATPDGIVLIHRR